MVKLTDSAAAELATYSSKLPHACARTAVLLWVPVQSFGRLGLAVQQRSLPEAPPQNADFAAFDPSGHPDREPDHIRS